MEIIYRCVDVAVKVNGETSGNMFGSNPEEKQKNATLQSSEDRFYAPTESVPLEMSITFDNRSGERTTHAYTLLTLLGAHSFRDLWKLLFDQLIVTPYLSNATAINNHEEEYRQSTFSYGVPTWLRVLRESVNQEQERATSVSGPILTNKKEDREIQESNRLVQEIHAMLEVNEKSVFDEDNNENTRTNCPMPTPEERSVSLLSSPFAIVVHLVEWHHVEQEPFHDHSANSITSSQGVESASTNVQASQHIKSVNNDDDNVSKNQSSSGDKLECSSTIPSFVQYTYKFHVTLPELQCNELIANMNNAETTNLNSNNNSKDDSNQRSLQFNQNAILLLLMLQSPLKHKFSVNTHCHKSGNYDNTISHVEAIRRVLSNSISNKYNGLPIGCSSIPIYIHRPLFVNHIACSRLRSSAFLLSCTVQNVLPSSSSFSPNAFVLELCSAEIDLRTTQRVSCTQMHHDAMKRELLKRFSTFSKNVIDHKKTKKGKKKYESKSNWSKVVSQYNKYVNISDQERIVNEKSKNLNVNKTRQLNGQEEQQELELTNNIKKKIVSLTSRWGVEYKDETTLSICNDCINVIPLSAETAPLPLELHLQETYSFQFMLELRPEVSYWLTQYADELLHSQVTETVHASKTTWKTSKPITQESSAAMLSAKKVALSQEQQDILQILPQQSHLIENDNLLVKPVEGSNANKQPHRSTSTPFAPTVGHSMADAKSSHSAPLHILDKVYNANDIIGALSQIYTTNLYLSYALRQVDKDDMHNQKQENDDNLYKQSHILHLTQPIT